MDRPFRAYDGDEAFVFVSYSHQDAELVYPELERLNAQGFNIWYDEGISPGAVWRDELGTRIESCSLFLLFISPGSSASDHCLKELNFALENNRPLLAVHLEQTELSAGLRLSLSDRQAILKYEVSETAYRAMLTEALEAHVAGAPARGPASAPTITRTRSSSPTRVAFVTAGVFALLLIGWLAYRPDTPASTESPAASVFEGRPAIAVLPFENLNGNPEEDYFVDGIVEDLIDRLASWRTFPVISGFSSFSYSGDVDVREAAEELGARYMVRGSVRREQDTVRISVSLLDAASGMRIWSQRYDRPFNDVLMLQDEITEAIVGAMDPEIRTFDEARARRANPDDLTAWDWSQRGWWHFSRAGRGSREDNGAALVAYQRAIESDPNLAAAAAGIALTHYQSVSAGWSADPDHSIEQLVKTADRAVMLDNRDPMSFHALGHAHALTGNRENMSAAFRRSLELNPSSSLVAICAGEGLAMAGYSEEAIEYLERAMRLSPRDPFVPWTYHSLALAHFSAARYQEAVQWAERAVNSNPEFGFAHRTRAASLAALGRLEEAKAALARAEVAEPDFNLAAGARLLITADPAVASRYLDGLRLAGFQG